MDPRENTRPAEAVRQEAAEVLPGISRAKAFFLAAAGLSFLMSVYLYFGGDRENGIYVGLWVPSILAAGALLMGSDGHE